MAQPTDVLTAAEARGAIGLQTGSDDEIALLVTAVSDQLDALCGPVIVRTVTSESHDGGGRTVRLRLRPVDSVTAAVEYDGTTETALTEESNTTKSADDFSVNTAAGVLYRRRSNYDWCYPAGRRNVVVSYAAGRFSHTTASDADLSKFKQAAQLMARHVWSATNGMGTETFSQLPVDEAASLLGPEVLNKVRGLLRGEFDTPAVG